MGWVYSKMAGTIARRHSNRTRTFCILFSDRHLHHYQHSTQLVVVDLPALTSFQLAWRLKRCSHGPVARLILRVVEPCANAHKAVATKTIQTQLDQHVTALLRCRRCPRMQSTPVSGGAIVSDVMVIGQAPGPREPVLQKPFAHTAGKTLFRWLEESCGINELAARSTIYFAAVCRCFPGKAAGGTDRVPRSIEIGNCSWWMSDEFEILRPSLVIPVGKLAIAQFVPFEKLGDVVGKKFAL